MTTSHSSWPTFVRLLSTAVAFSGRGQEGSKEAYCGRLVLAPACDAYPLGLYPPNRGCRSFPISVCVPSPSSRRARTSFAMPAKTITCPDCGLVLRISRNVAGWTLLYGVSDWQRRCKRLDFDNPAWCLVRRDGTSPKKEK
jgi:hypothetical protein